jgi:hypothetical protein
MRTYIKQLCVASLSVLFSTVVLSEFTLSKNEQVAFARGCNAWVDEIMGKHFVVDLSEAFGGESTPTYQITDFNSDTFQYYKPQWITSGSDGAYFETTIIASIRVEYTGDGWTLKDKTENVERSYTCLSVSKKRGVKPEVVAMHEVGENEFLFGDNKKEVLTFNLEWSLDYPRCKKSCQRIKAFVKKYSK